MASLRLTTSLPACVAAAALAALAAPALAQAPCTPGEPLTRLEKRLIAEHAKGGDELRRYVQGSAGRHHGLDWHDTRVWLDQRHRSPGCLAGAAGAAPSETRTR